MQLQRMGYIGAGVVLTLLAIGVFSARSAFATTSTSSSYQVSETQFGGGSTLQSCSGQYCTRASIGDIAGGSASNATSRTAFGPITPGEPTLEVIVDSGESNLGVLRTDRPATKTMVVRISSYLTDGYMLQIIGDTPKHPKHKLKAITSLAASKPGTEQFGINVVANTDPTIGANPAQVPSGEFSFGFATEQYAVPNMFKYVSGDVVARSDSESGRTDYTVSMIINVSNNTPAGHYSADFSAVVIPVF